MKVENRLLADFDRASIHSRKMHPPWSVAVCLYKMFFPPFTLLNFCLLAVHLCCGSGILHALSWLRQGMTGLESLTYVMTRNRRRH